MKRKYVKLQKEIDYIVENQISQTILGKIVMKKILANNGD